jgi:hypothetical protein
LCPLMASLNGAPSEAHGLSNPTRLIAMKDGSPFGLAGLW